MVQAFVGKRPALVVRRAIGHSLIRESFIKFLS
jgi:hypothetical protein